MSEENPERPQRKDNRPDGPNMPGLKTGRSVLTWMLVAGLVVLLIMLYTQSNQQNIPIPFSEFNPRLINGQVKSVAISGDELSGEFITAQPIPIGGATVSVLKYKTQAGNDGVMADGMQTHIRDTALKNHVHLEFKGNQSLLLNLFLPLLPLFALLLELKHQPLVFRNCNWS